MTVRISCGALLLMGSLLTGCLGEGPDPVGTEPDLTDLQLEDLIEDVGGVKGLSAFILPESDNFGQIPQDNRNPITSAKVELGRQLYNETGLMNASKFTGNNYTVSCASCHHSAAGFQAGIKQGIGDGGIGFGVAGEGRIPNPDYEVDSLDIQPIRTPSSLNAAFQKVTLWDGSFGARGANSGTSRLWTRGTPLETNFKGYFGIETQAIAGLSVHRMHVDSQLVDELGYKAQFDAIFANFSTDERYTTETAGLAIAAYERTLLANKAPFQEWLRGDWDALEEDEKQGALLFFGKARCVSCHSSPALNSEGFYALGMGDLDGPGVYGDFDGDTKNLGRGGFTQREGEYYKFKTPQLYNLKDVDFFGHGATFRSIREVVEYKTQNNGAIQNQEMPIEYLYHKFGEVELTDLEVDRLTAFLTNALYDPQLDRYDPASVKSGNCMPNSDPQSRVDLGCD
ncbi:cytochrome c peroxidase [Pontibacter sp. G13]|uniref:cytochrome-c peroxidase n=1 Tax=Pontibacter sp. G13 TaxID=3074898 RepID=UPI00288A1200|nr:cytochrome c peroxidase [Pontibacter sp. G13]WNJ19460.1 cytochrome c peroxidase [Pontibacter sp. G13]